MAAHEYFSCGTNTDESSIQIPYRTPVVQSHRESIKFAVLDINLYRLASACRLKKSAITYEVVYAIVSLRTSFSETFRPGPSSLIFPLMHSAYNLVTRRVLKSSDVTEVHSSLLRFRHCATLLRHRLGFALGHHLAGRLKLCSQNWLNAFTPRPRPTAFTYNSATHEHSLLETLSDRPNIDDDPFGLTKGYCIWHGSRISTS